MPMDELMKILVVTLTGMSVDAFEAQANDWLGAARDQRWKKLYTELTYQPMLEVLKHMRSSGYKTYIVTGGGQDFVRMYAERVYGVPPEHVVGTAGGTSFGYDKSGRPFLTKDPKLLLNDNNAGKPEGIHLMIGGNLKPLSAIRRETARCWNTPRRATLRDTKQERPRLWFVLALLLSCLVAIPARSSGPRRIQKTTSGLVCGPTNAFRQPLAPDKSLDVDFHERFDEGWTNLYEYFFQGRVAFRLPPWFTLIPIYRYQRFPGNPSIASENRGQLNLTLSTSRGPWRYNLRTLLGGRFPDDRAASARLRFRPGVGYTLPLLVTRVLVVSNEFFIVPGYNRFRQRRQCATPKSALRWKSRTAKSSSFIPTTVATTT
jgi:hypothetical protein